MATTEMNCLASGGGEVKPQNILINDLNTGSKAYIYVGEFTTLKTREVNADKYVLYGTTDAYDPETENWQTVINSLSYSLIQNVGSSFSTIDISAYTVLRINADGNSVSVPQLILSN